MHKFPIHLFCNYICGLPRHSGCLVFRRSIKTLKKEKRKSSRPFAEELVKFVKSKPSLAAVIDCMPATTLKPYKKPPSYFFIIDEDVAQDVASLIKDEVGSNTPVVEGNPGLGFLTKNLIQHQKKVMVFEARKPLTPFKKFVAENPESVTYVPADIFQIFNVTSQDKMDGGDRFNNIFKDIQYRYWHEEPALTIVGVVPSLEYIKYLMRQTVFQNGLGRVGRVTNILLLNDSIYPKITPKPTPLSKSYYPFFLELFFDFKKLGEFPRRAVVPWDKQQIADTEKLHLVRVDLKADTHQRFPEPRLITLFHFVRTLARSRHTKVMAFFENWVPGSGLHLIREGFGPLLEVGELSSANILQLFDIFINLPEFDEINFINICHLSIDRDEKNPTR